MPNILDELPVLRKEEDDLKKLKIIVSFTFLISYLSWLSFKFFCKEIFVSWEEKFRVADSYFFFPLAMYLFLSLLLCALIILFKMEVVFLTLKKNYLSIDGLENASSIGIVLHIIVSVIFVGIFVWLIFIMVCLTFTIIIPKSLYTLLIFSGGFYKLYTYTRNHIQESYKSVNES